MTAMALLNWARGPGLQIAVALFLLGLVVRLLEMWLLGRRPVYSVPRTDGFKAGWATVWRRFTPAPGLLRAAPLVIIAGYIFHVGLFLTLLFFVPHILLFREIFGISWPGLPFYIIDALTILSIAALVALLVHRLLDPVRRYLAGFHDYYIWTVTLLPLVTGYFAYHKLLLPYTLMLALHILSAELLLISIPLTKLMHTFTFMVARWYNGHIIGRKGVRA